MTGSMHRLQIGNDLPSTIVVQPLAGLCPNQRHSGSRVLDMMSSSLTAQFIGEPLT